jgi:hypothetical protein
MILMAMELLAFYDQFVADLPPHDKQNDLRSLDIVQNAEVSDAPLELGKRVRTQPLDGPGQRRRLMEETGLNRRFEEAVLAGRQRVQLRFGVHRDRYR